MRYRKLGRTELKCSEISLGTWAFASQVYGNVEEDTARAAVSEALELGINFFDTAPLYGDSERDGIAEGILGRALGSHRDDVLISTKFGRYSSDGAAPNFHARRARESVEGSLRRLGTDRIDVLFFHSPFGPHDIHDDVWEELAKLKQEGKVRHIGHSISMFQQTKTMASEWAEQRRIDVIQVVYSLLNREAGDLIAQLGSIGIGVVARESLANGFLTGAITRDTVFPANNLNNRYSREEIIERVGQVERLAELLVRDDVSTIAQAAMRWVLNNPSVSTVLSGAKKPEEIRDCANASDAAPYSAEEMERAASLHRKDYPAA